MILKKKDSLLFVLLVSKISFVMKYQMQLNNVIRQVFGYVWLQEIIKLLLWLLLKNVVLWKKVKKMKIMKTLLTIIITAMSVTVIVVIRVTVRVVTAVIFIRVNILAIVLITSIDHHHCLFSHLSLF